MSKKKYKLSTIRMLKQMHRNVREIYECYNGIHRVMMNPLKGGGSIVRVTKTKDNNMLIPRPAKVTINNQNPYQYSEILVITDNVMRNWKWRKMKSNEYNHIIIDSLESETNNV